MLRVIFSHIIIILDILSYRRKSESISILVQFMLCNESTYLPRWHTRNEAMIKMVKTMFMVACPTIVGGYKKSENLHDFGSSNMLMTYIVASDNSLRAGISGSYRYC